MQDAGPDASVASGSSHAPCLSPLRATSWVQVPPESRLLRRRGTGSNQAIAPRHNMLTNVYI